MEKILIVEDDIAFGTMIQTWLKKKGFEVEKATSVKAAIQIYEKTESGFDGAGRRSGTCSHFLQQ